MRVVWLDGSAEAVSELDTAVAAALDGGEAVLPLSSADPAAPGVLEAMAPDTPVEPDTTVIIATSGSTGAPKGVLLSAGALTASATATHARLGGPGHWLLATPAHYIGGLQVLVRARLAGTKAALLTGAGFRPDEFAAAAAPVLAESGPRYTALVPTQLVRLLDDDGAGLAAARAFDGIVLGAAATSAKLRTRAGEAGVRIVPAYGMSETASGCVYDGMPLDGVRVEPDADERLCISGPVLAHGYRLAPELTGESFRDGWFRTSDRGRLLADGRVEVLGRADDVINTGGVKVSAASVEQVVAGISGVRDVCVVGVPDPQWGETVVALVVADGPVAQETIKEVTREELGAAAAPKRVEFADELPLRGPGKIDRAAVKARFDPGTA
ncbi:o-succinylbenzoate--CoA ligase [Amycolatopsis rhabdoformis]|uniref:O-succinylbenzoate--CoA ligase n=1 Tax=Amycolatopsis rhabdoformis TaxID=1448059 RepID=A0ABZ1I3J6_9PSEU|nr:o-succinylbenzoate--CoA ligase [Amycolatopsis rhabdoformis]WSE28979.1 o-succinylbenzoate--CoA ligase [Amycolatopsis rhabdoformis]